MRAWLIAFTIGLLWLDTARAEESPSAKAPPTASTAQPTPVPPTASAAAKAWTGPRVALSYRLYSLRDWQGGGRVNSVAFSGFLPTRYVRAGGGAEAGGRNYEHGTTEGLLSGNIFAGYQHLGDLGRVLPYLVAVGEFGFTFGKRFHTPVSRGFRGAGVELGADINLVRSLYVGVGLSYMLYTMGGLGYDTFGMRLSIGL
jgi:hypothetical protein